MVIVSSSRACPDKCALCNQDGDSREHVLPQWFLKRWDRQRQFTVDVNQQPLRSRKGTGSPVTSEKIWRVMLPLCQPCNTALNLQFEVQAKEPVRAALDRLTPLTDPTDIHHVARWVAKTLALGAHPDTDHTVLASLTEDGLADGDESPAPDWTNRKNRKNPWIPFPQSVRDAIRNGELPSDLSLWVAITEKDKDGLPDPNFETVYLGETQRNDGAGGAGFSAHTSWNVGDISYHVENPGDDRHVLFQLVYHPLHDFVHPFEASGFVTRLWPNPPSTLDLANLPVLAHTTKLISVFRRSNVAISVQAGQRCTDPAFKTHWAEL